MIIEVDHKISPKLREALRCLCPFPEVAKQELDQFFADKGYYTPTNEYIVYPEILGELGIGEEICDAERVEFIYCWRIILNTPHSPNRELRNQFHEVVQSLIERKIVSMDYVTITNAPVMITVIHDYDNAGRYYCFNEELEQFRQDGHRRIEETFARAKTIAVITSPQPIP